MKTELMPSSKTDYVSLSALATNMQIYEQLPVSIQKALKKSIWITVIINLICIPVLIALPELIESALPVYDGFFIWFTSDVANFVLRLTYDLSPFLLTLNIISLTLSIGVLIASTGMTKSVSEPVHWLAWAAAFPSGISAVTAVILTAFFLTVIVLAIIIWIVIIAIVITIIGGVLAALAGGK